MKIDSLHGRDPAPPGIAGVGVSDDPFGPRPPGAVDFDLTISLPDGEASPHVSLHFESVEDLGAYQDALIVRGVGALVRRAMDAAAERPLTFGAPDPSNAHRVSSLPMPVAEHGSADVAFMKLAAYARRAGYSVRTIANFVDEGLPTVGGGRLRRVDVEAADEWLRNLEARRRLACSEVEADAQEDARRAGGRRGSR